MVVVFLILVVVLLGLLLAVLLGRVPARGVLPPVTTESFSGLPRGGVDPQDLGDLRFDQVVRGYRMSQVDEVLARLSDELATRDAEIDRLRQERERADGDL